MIVLDASVVLELLLSTPTGVKVGERLREPGTSLHAPHLVDVEVTQVIRRYVLANTLTENRGRMALDHLAALDLERYSHTLLLPRVWQLRRNLTAYDAVYVALAEILEAPLLTADRRLATAPGVLAPIELI